MAESNIWYWKPKEDNLRKMLFSKQVDRGEKYENSEIEKELFEWVDGKREDGLTVSLDFVCHIFAGRNTRTSNSKHHLTGVTVSWRETNSVFYDTLQLHKNCRMTMKNSSQASKNMWLTCRSMTYSHHRIQKVWPYISQATRKIDLLSCFLAWLTVQNYHSMLYSRERHCQRETFPKNFPSLWEEVDGWKEHDCCVG